METLPNFAKADCPNNNGTSLVSITDAFTLLKVLLPILTVRRLMTVPSEILPSAIWYFCVPKISTGVSVPCWGKNRL